MPAQIVSIMIMSGVQDGTLIEFSQEVSGTTMGEIWSLSIGRHEDNDLVLKNDTFVSRKHARIFSNKGRWLLEDSHSTNGTFVENPDDLFLDKQIVSSFPILPGNLFRVGRTWLRIQITD